LTSAVEGAEDTVTPREDTVPVVAESRIRRLPSRLRDLARGHRLFTALLAVATLLRLDAMLGYRPAVWFNDSFDYLHVAMSLYPHPIRTDGYPFFLWALKPLHSFALVAGLQHAMGLATGIMVYALLRKRFALPAWGATLAAAPALLDAYQIQLEHLILSDAMFGFLLAVVVVALLWYDTELTWKRGAVIGLVLGLMSLTRSVGLPVLLAVVIYLFIRRINWRIIAAVVALCAMPLAAYAGWFYSWYGKPGLTMSSGIFLYARVTAFADCNKINPPVAEIPLCNNPKVTNTPLVFSQDAIWDKNSPLLRYSSGRFTPFINQTAQDYATRAILAQPGDYLRVVAEDFLRTFKWNRDVFPDRATYEMYQFNTKSAALPDWRMSKDRTAANEARAYEEGDARTQIIQPYSTAIRLYQRYIYLRGTMLGLILLVGLAGLVPMWRRLGGRAFLPWVTATGLLIVPAATAEFDYRYVLPVVPLACIAAAITFSQDPRRKLAGLARRHRESVEPAVEPPAPAELTA
jgi:hypothetical protein